MINIPPDSSRIITIRMRSLEFKSKNLFGHHLGKNGSKIINRVVAIQMNVNLKISLDISKRDLGTASVTKVFLSARSNANKGHTTVDLPSYVNN